MTNAAPWAVARRLDYIDWCLAERGEVQRRDLMTPFNISDGQASADINEFLAAYPDAATYDKSRRRYVPARRPYRRRRKNAWTTAIDYAAVTA